MCRRRSVGDYEHHYVIDKSAGIKDRLFTLFGIKMSELMSDDETLIFANSVTIFSSQKLRS